MLTRLTTRLHRVYSAMWPPKATRRKVPEAHRSTDYNWQTMDLLYRYWVVDELGRWWRVETRQCPYTGTIMRQQRRLTD